MFEYFGVMPDLTALLDAIIDAEPPLDDPEGRAELETMRLMRNALDHQIVTRAAQLDRLRVAERSHSTLRRLLMDMGFPPAAASRIVRIVARVSALDVVKGHAADGRLSTEIVDAIVRGINHIESVAA